MSINRAVGLRRVIAAEVVSNLGSMMSRLALPWLAVLTLDAKPWQMALLAVADVLAGALAALALGVAIDRRSQRGTMIAADLARMLLLGALAVATLRGHLSFGLLLGVAAAAGVLTMAFDLARSAWMARVVPVGELSRANASLATGTAISEAAAFAAAGAVFQWAGGVAALLLDAGSFLVSALLLRRVPDPRPTPTAPAPAATGTPAAPWRLRLAQVTGDPALRALAALDALVALAGGIAGTAYMIFVSRELALPTVVLGLVFALGGLGSAIGAALAPGLGRRIGGGGALAWGLATAAVGSACIPLADSAALAPWVLLAAHQLLGDAGLVIHLVHDRTLRQSLVAPQALAGIDGAMRALAQFATVAGALAGGAFASAYGVRPALWLATALLLAAAVLGTLAWRQGALPGSRTMA